MQRRLLQNSCRQAGRRWQPGSVAASSSSLKPARTLSHRQWTSAAFGSNSTRSRPRAWFPSRLSSTTTTTTSASSLAASAAAVMFGNNYNPEKDIPDLTGKVAVVTGGSQGIGLGITAHLLSHNPAKIVVVANSAEHFKEAQDFLKDFGDVSKVTFQQTNLADLASTNASAKQLKAELPQIDMLILNAGIGVAAYETSQDGIDHHFQINVLSHYIFAQTLLPILQHTAAQTGDARLVFMSSSLHKQPPPNVKYESLDELNQDVGPLKLYGRTKLADLLLAKDMVRKHHLHNTNLFCNATHPGGVSTGQQSQMETEDAYNKFGTVLVAALRPLFKDPITKGCRSALWAATAPDVKSGRVTGEYIVPDGKVETPSKEALDEQLGDNVWSLCNAILTQKGVPVDFPLK